MSNPFKYISKVGVEIEAGWKTRRTDLHKDDSLQAADFPGDTKAIGEIVSNPLATREELFSFMNSNYGDYGTARCSIHVHFSLRNCAFYSRLMDKSFYSHFLAKMREWGESYHCTNPLFWERLSGKNRYCIDQFWPDEQVSCKNKDQSRRVINRNGVEHQIRQTLLNYCYGQFKTIECRLFPRFDSIDTAVSAINALFDCIESYLDTNPVASINMNYVISEIPEDKLKNVLGNIPNLDNFKLKPVNIYELLSNRVRPNSPKIKNLDIDKAIF